MDPPNLNFVQAPLKAVTVVAGFTWMWKQDGSAQNDTAFIGSVDWVPNDDGIPVTMHSRI